MHRFFRSLEKDQRHAVAGRQSNQLARCIAFSNLGSFPNDLIELFHHLALRLVGVVVPDRERLRGGAAGMSDGDCQGTRREHARQWPSQAVDHL